MYEDSKQFSQWLCHKERDNSSISKNKIKNLKGLYTYLLNTKKRQVRECRNETSFTSPQYVLYLALSLHPHDHSLDSETPCFQFALFH